MVGKPEVTRFIPSRGLLATNLPLFPRRLQLPIPLGLNLLHYSLTGSALIPG
jgi:hypothetical protein